MHDPDLPPSHHYLGGLSTESLDGDRRDCAAPFGHHLLRTLRPPLPLMRGRCPCQRAVRSGYAAKELGDRPSESQNQRVAVSTGRFAG